MNAPSVDIKKLLEAESLGVPIEIGRESPGRIDCLTIYDYGGGYSNPKLAIDTVYIQVRSRSTKYVAGYERLDAVKLFLEGKSQLTVNGTKYVGFWVMGSIASLGYDENKLAIFTINFRIIREPMESEVGNRQLISSS